MHGFRRDRPGQVARVIPLKTALLPTALAAGLAGCGGSEDSSSKTPAKTETQAKPTQTSPRKPKVTRAAGSLPGGRIPAKALREKGAALALAKVTIGGKAFQMVVDTGAQESNIDVRAAKQLGLAARGKPRTLSSIGCTKKVQPVRIAAWSAGSVKLPPTVALAQKTESYTKSKGKIIGLLGADVIARFGSLEIDYGTDRVVLGGSGPQGGKSFKLKSGRVKDAVIIVAKVSVHGRLLPFVPDTGASRSTIDLAVAKKLGLTTRGKPKRASAIGCGAKVQPLTLDRWKAGSTTLPKTLALGTSSLIRKKSGLAGLIGGDVFSRFGTIYFDFKHNRGVLK